MSITNELRLFAADPYTGWVPTDKQQADLRAIADRIDAEHERQLEVLYRDMSDAEYVKLPKDADGEYINEHDEVDWRDHAGTWHENATVVAVCSDGCYVMDGTVFHVHKSDIRHHHAPTVEDVLLDMHRRLSGVSELYDVDSDELEDEYTRIIEECAVKVREVLGE